MTTVRTTRLVTIWPGSIPRSACGEPNGHSMKAESACPRSPGGPAPLPPGTTTDHIGYFGDWMATAADLAGAELPPDVDSISFAPTLREMPDASNSNTSICIGNSTSRGAGKRFDSATGKRSASRCSQAQIQLYDLSEDIGEANDVRQAASQTGSQSDRDDGSGAHAPSQLEAAAVGSKRLVGQRHLYSKHRVLLRTMKEIW